MSCGVYQAHRTRAAAANNQKEDAPHLYMSWSLHCFRPITRRNATFMAGESNDFFLVDVICHARLGKPTGAKEPELFDENKVGVY